MNLRHTPYALTIVLASIAVVCLIVFAVGAPMTIDPSPGPPAPGSQIGDVLIAAAAFGAIGGGLAALIVGIIELSHHRGGPRFPVGLAATIAGGATFVMGTVWFLVQLANGISAGT
jgi:hypothetical protein